MSNCGLLGTLPKQLLLVVLLLLESISCFKLALAQQYSSRNYNNNQARPMTSSGQLQDATYSVTGRGDSSHCPCDEAKYELIFEGLWSKYTHPDNFPQNHLLASFGDIIGASHSSEFRMWEPNQFASEGVKELAETGSTKKLESELKQVSSKTRTIIKARELHYPTLNSKTSAVFRTDRQHHLVSILSKLGPSPDWMVGVTALDLCRDSGLNQERGWAVQKLVYLYIWDAGTDSGINFTSPDLPTRPQEYIHPFRKQQTYQEQAASDGQSQFVADDQATTTTPSPPTSQGYESSFVYTNGSANLNLPLESSTYVRRSVGDSMTSSFGSSDIIHSPQSDQTKPYARLTITRQRIYEKACNNQQSSSDQFSVARPTSSPAYQESTIQSESASSSSTSSQRDCRTTEWSDWSSCTTTCGKGLRTRTRDFKDERALASGCSKQLLIGKEICISDCTTGCVTRNWSEWSSCSVSCGSGRRKRTRSLVGPKRAACGKIELVQWDDCTGLDGPNCGRDQDAPADATISPCRVSDWSEWTECSNPCGKGIRMRMRQFLIKDSVQKCKVRLVERHNCLGSSPSCGKKAGKGRFA